MGRDAAGVAFGAGAASAVRFGAGVTSAARFVDGLAGAEGVTTIALAMVAGISLLSVPFFLRMSPDAGAEISGRAAPRGSAD